MDDTRLPDDHDDQDELLAKGEARFAHFLSQLDEAALDRFSQEAEPLCEAIQDTIERVQADDPFLTSMHITMALQALLGHFYVHVGQEPATPEGVDETNGGEAP